MRPPHESVRTWLEAREECLSPYAAKSQWSIGRLRQEESSPTRTAFQRDRDRIVHSKSFRRLKHKTQVFIAPLGDHYVTRLTHTLEVSQVARSIVRGLNLNEDLAEAIALGHDLGHTPFGHVGEEVLNELSPWGFKHNEQSLRVIDVLENSGLGLNLTHEVREGILKHSKSRVEVMGHGWGTVDTLEGQVCKIADLVAYINHDIDDALRADLIKEGDLPGEAVRLLGSTRSRRIDTIICDIIDNSWAARGETSVQNMGRPTIAISTETSEAMNSLRGFLFERVYNGDVVNREAERAKKVLRFLHHYFMEHQDLLPAEYCVRDEPPARRVIDYVAGMTDQYALRLADDCGLL